MDAGATAATGLRFSKGKLLLHGAPVTTVTPKRAHLDFLSFLKARALRVILVAQNGWRFDEPTLCRELKDLKLWDPFKRLVFGFVDTLPFFRKKLATSKPPAFTQSALAEFYGISNVEAHNAVNDCRVLSAIVSAAGVSNSGSNEFFKVVDFQEREDLEKFRKSHVIKTYSHFSDFVKSTTLNRLAAANITFEDLQHAYAGNGGDGIRQVLSEDVAGKPRITKSKAVIDRLIVGFRQL